mmetsp:Transcript_21288/g.46197  ORF Transcript_21288/g.46197 Transcript_21288/m.46197 type:complete len:930 (+) Transcript_21288:77-2866(+)
MFSCSVPRQLFMHQQTITEEIIKQIPKSIAIHMVINLTLVPISIPTYISRLNYTSNLVVSFFDNTEDGHMASELVEVLRRCDEKVPRELGALVPPPLMTPRNDNSNNAASFAAGDQGDNNAVNTNLDNRGRAIPLRGDSHSPIPNPANNNNDEGTRRRRQFLQNRNTTVSQNSSDDERSLRNTNNEASSSGDLRVMTNNQNGRGMSFMPTQERREMPMVVRPNPVRRVRHAEVVLVDQCLVAYGWMWVRLRWPGEQGGFVGFVALGLVDEMRNNVGLLQGGEGGEGNNNNDGAAQEVLYCQEVNSSSSKPPPITTLATRSATQTTLLCQETNSYYPTSAAMKLLPLYDDGLNSAGNGEDGMESLMGSLENGEPVFCRICREGLHDVNYDLETATNPSAPQQPTAEESAASRGRAGGGNAATNTMHDSLASANTASSSTAAIGNAQDSDSSISTAQQDERVLRRSSSANNNTQSSPSPPNHHLLNLPPLILHHPTAENPLLAPCDCTGTMAFVHYLCIEQWRCRSRHPGARNGLNCETCGAEYTLPPPPSRPASRSDIMNGGLDGGPNGMMGEDDWLDAMPPHVLAALRRPHFAWQLGAAVVRRRWLRPVVPIVVSPLVALYCRARRTLKKRGVSRRRWACSLCRRRARWKCVRCLRSYYCSRQCQNVSWHIVHKHVCYKPVRFWWSVVVYTVGLFMTVPGIVENFPIYDAMITLLPINFIALGIVGGGIASALKRSSGIDIRGRILEVIVVVLTCLLTGVSSGLVRGYFGDASLCWGVFAPSPTATVVARENDFEGPVFNGPFYPSILNTVLVDIPLKQIQLWYLKWDFILSKLGFISHKLLCFPAADGNADYSNIGCSPSTRGINPQFYLEDGNEGRCSADVSLVMGIWFMALGVLLMGNMYRRLRGGGRRNNVAAAVHRGRRRPHQD